MTQTWMDNEGRTERLEKRAARFYRIEEWYIAIGSDAIADSMKSEGRLVCVQSREVQSWYYDSCC